MKLSTRGKYGVYAMYYLACHQYETPQSLQNIASIGVPKQYLEQLLGDLRRAGLVRTVRGAQGGYQIAKNPEDISVLAVIDATEGPLALSECTTREDCCQRSLHCPVRPVWLKLTEAINRELAGVTLADLFLNRNEGEVNPNE